MFTSRVSNRSKNQFNISKTQSMQIENFNKVLQNSLTS